MIKNPTGVYYSTGNVLRFDNPNKRRDYFASGVKVELFTKPQIKPLLYERLLLQVYDKIEESYEYFIGLFDGAVFIDSHFLYEFEKENSFECKDFKLLGWFLLP